MTTIKTTEQAATLPVGSVVRDQHGEVAIRRKAGWDFNGYTATTSELMDYGPLTVLHDPTQPAPAGVIDREALWDAIVAVRDASPRLKNDAETDDIIDAILNLLPGRTVAQVKAEAWDEGYATGHDCVGAATDCTRRPNPYRADELEREDKR